MTTPVAHPAVQHPSAFLAAERRFNDWAARHLGVVFGSIWTVWVFLVYPLAALLLPKPWQDIVFFISSGWIQLWALPLLNLNQNKADAQRAAKADADHAALTHVAQQSDRSVDLLGRVASHLGVETEV